jgi:hypothetical protein
VTYGDDAAVSGWWNGGRDSALRPHFGRVAPAGVQRPAVAATLCFAHTTTFIKFGQTLSLRRDLLRSDYIDALQSIEHHFPTTRRRCTVPGCEFIALGAVCCARIRLGALVHCAVGEALI